MERKLSKSNTKIMEDFLNKIEVLLSLILKYNSK